MNVLRRIVVALAGVVVVALAMELAAPKAVHALVSTLVTVANTSANPVPTIGADAARAFVAGGTCTFSGSNVCTSSVFMVTSGETAVIESISDFCEVDPGTAVGEVRMNFYDPVGSQVVVSIAPAPAVSQPIYSANFSTSGQNLKTYAGAGAIDVSAFSGNNEIDKSDVCRFTLSGHLVP